MLKSYGWGGGGGGGPCDFSVSPSPFGLDFGTSDSGLTIYSSLIDLDQHRIMLAVWVQKIYLGIQAFDSGTYGLQNKACKFKIYLLPARAVILVDRMIHIIWYCVSFITVSQGVFS